MKHYICTGGCKGISDESGVCQAKDCPKVGQPLSECTCVDEKHEEEPKESETELSKLLTK